METLEALAARIDTTEDIQSIVRTMKSLSAVSIRQYEQAVDALHDYQHTIELGLQVVLQDGAPATPRGGPDGAEAAIIIGSDRGLCGRFNEGLIDFVEDRLGAERAGEEQPLILAVGARAAARLEASGRSADKIFALPGSVAGLVKTAQSVLIQTDRWREERRIAHVRIFYNRRTEESRARASLETLLPMPADDLARLAERPWPSRRLPMFTMDGADLFSWLVRQHLFISVFRAAAESLASEHASRLAAMQAAERNIDERLEELSAEYRKKRQESITTELMDIVAGFEAMRTTAERTP